MTPEQRATLNAVHALLNERQQSLDTAAQQVSGRPVEFRDTGPLFTEMAASIMEINVAVRAITDIMLSEEES